MNLRQIEAFKTVMHSGSITMAADILGLTQPTISKLIAQLESETRLKLFDRARGRLFPRPEAHNLLKDVEAVLDALESVGRNARDLARGRIGHLRIAAIPPLSAEFLPKAAAEFMKKRPGVQVTIHVRPPRYVKDWVANQQADIGFVSEGPDIIGAVSTPFQDHPGAVCILPKGHKLAEKSALKPADFANQPFISLGRVTAFRQRIDQLFREARVERRITAETNHFTAACSLVAEGAGTCIVDPFTALYFHKTGTGVLRPFEPEVKFVVNLLKPANQAPSLLANEFVASLAASQKAMTQSLRSLLER